MEMSRHAATGGGLQQESRRTCVWVAILQRALQAFDILVLNKGCGLERHDATLRCLRADCRVSGANDGQTQRGEDTQPDKRADRFHERAGSRLVSCARRFWRADSGTRTRMATPCRTTKLNSTPSANIVAPTAAAVKNFCKFAGSLARRAGNSCSCALRANSTVCVSVELRKPILNDPSARIAALPSSDARIF